MKKFLRLTAACLCIIILAAGAAGCSSEATTANGTGDESKTLTIAVSNEVTTLYPMNMDVQNHCVTKLVYEGLVRYVDGEIVPGLAERWEFNDDGMELTFYLKEGVKFHDGEDFNAEAVKKNLEYYQASAVHAFMKVVFTLEEVEIIDDYTVTLHFPNPYFAYLNELCYPEVLIMVSPNAIEQGNYQTMNGVIGTGAYIYEEVKTGEYVRFVRNENYWGESAYYDEVIVKYIPEAASRLQALQNGEVDLLYGNALVSYDDYQQAISMNGIEGIVADENSRTRTIVVNASQSMLSDVKVREAIAYAINKETLSSGLTYGFEEAADTLFPSGDQYTDVDLNVIRSYDKEKSESLLNEAGWEMNDSTGFREKDGVTLSLMLTYDSGEAMNESLAILIKSQLAEVGINVETVGQDQLTWWTEGVSGNYDLTIQITAQPFATPQDYFTPMLDMYPHINAIEAMPDGEEFNAAIREYATTGDEERIAEIFDYLINYINDNVIVIPLTYLKDVVVYDADKIKGYEFSGQTMFFDINGIEAE